jgi:hypothetical protein
MDGALMRSELLALPSHPVEDFGGDVFGETTRQLCDDLLNNRKLLACALRPMLTISPAS